MIVVEPFVVVPIAAFAPSLPNPVPLLSTEKLIVAPLLTVIVSAEDPL